MADARPIYVLFVPHGGSSATAGVLENLGVPMGEWKPRRSLYDTYEDARARQFAVWPQPRDADAEGFRRYMKLRDSEGVHPWGVKVLAHRILVEYPDVRNAFRYVWVWRPLEETIVRDAAETGGDPAPERAGVLAHRWAETKRLVGLVRPEVSFPFRQLLDSPAGVVHELIRSLDLKPSQDQITAAINFIRKPGGVVG